MRYSQEQEDRALANLMEDIKGQPPKRASSGTGFCLIMLVFILGLFVILASGCNTMAGIGKDIQAVSEGTQEKMADGVDRRKGN